MANSLKVANIFQHKVKKITSVFLATSALTTKQVTTTHLIHRLVGEKTINRNDSMSTSDGNERQSKMFRIAEKLPPLIKV